MARLGRLLARQEERPLTSRGRWHRRIINSNWRIGPWDLKVLGYGWLKEELGELKQNGRMGAAEGMLCVIRFAVQGRFMRQKPEMIFSQIEGTTTGRRLEYTLRAPPSRAGGGRDHRRRESRDGNGRSEASMMFPRCSRCKLHVQIKGYDIGTGTGWD